MNAWHLPENSFNTQPSTLMHIDLNSCFAAIEQQANPKLQGIPTVVAAYATDGGCILAASVEAKKLGIKTGMRLGEAKKINSRVAILLPDPPKYRYVHQKMMKIFESYTPNVEPKSIDEAVLDFGRDDFGGGLRESCPLTPGVGKPKSELRPSGRLPELRRSDSFRTPLEPIARQIKHRIKQEIGEWLTVSIGLGPNRFLAKTAASIKKPDGLEEINGLNVEGQLKKLELIDLCGINKALKLRLNLVGIFTPVEFLHANLLTLKSAFRSIAAYHWYGRLRGFETDDWKSGRQSLGHSYALPRPTVNLKTLAPILHRLCEKVGTRLRNNGYQAGGVSLGILYWDWTHSSHRQKLDQPIFASADIYTEALKILSRTLDTLDSRSRRIRLRESDPNQENPGVRAVRNLSVSVFNLSETLYQQQTLFADQVRKRSLSQALDEINNRYGDFTITLADTLEMKKKILDRIAFGGIRDLSQVV